MERSGNHRASVVLLPSRCGRSDLYRHARWREPCGRGRPSCRHDRGVVASPTSDYGRRANNVARSRTMDAAQFHIKPRASAERTAFYDRLGRQNTAPLWEVLSEAITVEPKPVTVPVIWRYDEVRPLLMEAAGLLTVEEA